MKIPKRLSSFKQQNFYFILFVTLILSATVSSSTPPLSSSHPHPHHDHPDPQSDIDWDSFGFSLNHVRTNSMWHSKVHRLHSSIGNGMDYEDFSPSSEECLVPLQPLSLHPSCTVLNYGQSLFEGLKAFRRADGSIALFRPDRNAQRMYDGAQRLLLPPVPISIFIKAADAVTRENAKWVPPHGKGALYLRPLLFGSGEGLGVKPSEAATFCIYASPVGNYFKGGLKAIKLQAVKGYSRAAPGGSGCVKAGGNYAPAFLVQGKVKERGYDEALFLDAVSGEAIEEAGASNFFAVYPNNTIVTPPLSSGTILPGVTRASIIELAEQECGCTVLERRLHLADLHGVAEAFCCGTGASITPVGGVNVDHGNDFQDEGLDYVFGDGKSAGPLTQKLYQMLLDIQMGTGDAALKEKYEKWIHIVHPTEGMLD